MRVLTHLSGFDVFCGFCRSGHRVSVFIDLSHPFCAPEFKQTHTKHYEYHETLIGFITTAETPPLRDRAAHPQTPHRRRSREIFHISFFIYHFPFLMGSKAMMTAALHPSKIIDGENIWY